MPVEWSQVSLTRDLELADTLLFGSGVTGDKDPYTQWVHCERIVSTDNMLPQYAQWAHFDHIQNLPTNVAKMCVPNLFRICTTTVATICPAVT